MVINNYHARILVLGEVKEANGFRKCFATIETKEKKDEFDEVVYAAEKFEVEIAIKDDKVYHELLQLAPTPGGVPGGVYFPATLNLRSFVYKEKDRDKLGKQLQLKRWAR